MRCGTKLREGAKFCANCRTPIATASAVTTLDQCVEAFEFIINKIEEIEKDIDLGVSAIYLSGAFREALGLEEYTKIAKKIQSKTQKVVAGSTLINNFLMNKVVLANNKEIEDGKIKIEGCVSMVDVQVFAVRGIIEGYKRNKKVDTPSIDICIDLFRKSVDNFNLNIQNWNRKFKARISKVGNL
jgi:hypothetical protein